MFAQPMDNVFLLIYVIAFPAGLAAIVILELADTFILQELMQMVN
jgi:hypothetical protein